MTVLADLVRIRGLSKRPILGKTKSALWFLCFVIIRLLFLKNNYWSSKMNLSLIVISESGWR